MGRWDRWSASSPSSPAPGRSASRAAPKGAYVKDELGFDAAVDHKGADFAAQLAAACPDGIDVYFENVGGAIWQAVLPLLNKFARVPVSGLVAQYNAAGPGDGIATGCPLPCARSCRRA